MATWTVAISETNESTGAVALVYGQIEYVTVAAGQTVGIL